MVRIIFATMMGVLMLTIGQITSADSYSDCKAGCNNALHDCISSTAGLDEAAANDAKGACMSDRESCIAKCYEENKDKPLEFVPPKVDKKKKAQPPNQDQQEQSQPAPQE